MEFPVVSGPEELRSAFACVACDVRRPVFDEEERQVALLLPFFEPVAPFLDRGPVQIAVDREDLSQISAAVMIHSPAGINLLQNVFRQQSLIPAVAAERSQSGLSGGGGTDAVRILLIGIAHRIVAGGEQNDSGDVLIAPDLMFRNAPVFRRVDRIFQIEIEILHMGHGHRGEDSGLRRCAPVGGVVAAGAGGEIVDAFQKEIDMEFPVDLKHVREHLIGGFGGEAGVGDRGGAKMDLPAVQIEMAAADAELAEAELFRIEGVQERSVGGEELQTEGIEVLRGVNVPEFRIAPGGGEGNALPGTGERF